MPTITLPTVGEQGWGPKLNTAITTVNSAVDGIATDYVSDDALADALAGLAFYTKPNGGIPESDLSIGAQSKLNAIIVSTGSGEPNQSTTGLIYVQHETS